MSSLLSSYFDSIATLSDNTIKQRKSCLDRWIRFLLSRDKELLEAKKFDLSAFAREALDAEVADSAVKGYLLRIKYFYQFAFEEEVFPGKEYKRIALFANSFRVDKGKIITPLSQDHLEILKQEIAYHRTLQISTFMLLNFGLRLSELIKLNVRDINFQDKELLVRRSKYKRSRVIPFNRKIQQVILLWLDTRDNYLPTGSSDDAFLILKYTSSRSSKQWLQQEFWKINQKHKDLDLHVTAQRLRHHFACRLYYELGYEIYDVSWVLGHESIKTTMVYLGIDEQMRKESYLQMLLLRSNTR
ncbi:MAG: site-specific integrase [Candidatus Heimdallarchaeota archaeon]